MVCLTSGGSDTVMGEPHVIKWPIAILRTIATSSSYYADATNNVVVSSDPESRSEQLLRYRRTPSVACNRTKLAYSQDRTPGMCTVMDFWPVK